jgi:hypothetical protein
MDVAYTAILWSVMKRFLRGISINNIRVMVMDASHLDIGRLWETLI